MGDFWHTVFEAYLDIILGPVWGATYNIGIGNFAKSSQVKSNLFSNNIISTAIATNNRVLTYDN